MKNEYIPHKVKIKKIIDEAPGTKTFVLDTKIEHDPGQFVQIGLLGYGECPISISSYAKQNLELCIHNVGNVTNKLHGLKPGSEVLVRGPYGSGYDMEFFKNDNLIIIGGGTGVAPLRGIIRFVENNRKMFNNVDLFFGFRSPDDVLFKYDMKKWKKEFNLHMTVDKADKKWKGDKGVVTVLLEKAKLDPENSIVMCVGPPIMIKFVIQTLQKLGFKDEQIYMSLERLMRCGIGKCGHCAIGGKYVCKQGPVFNYTQAKKLVD